MDSVENIKLAWVDIETTGLDARYDVPLELGLMLTDEQGYPIYADHWLIHDDTTEYKEKIAFASRHNIVGPMHEKSGLWSDLFMREEIGYFSRTEMDQFLAQMFQEHKIPAIPMAGSSTGSLDRPFVLEHFPLFNKVLSYRNVDVSTIKELCKMHNPLLWENLSPMMGSKEDAPHRVLGDLEGAITEYRLYLENFLILGD